MGEDKEKKASTDSGVVMLAFRRPFQVQCWGRIGCWKIQPLGGTFVQGMDEQ